jgi:TonB family protein
VEGSYKESAVFESDSINLDNADHEPASAEFFEIRIATRSLPVRIEYAAIRSLHSVVSGESRSVGLLLGTYSSQSLSVDYCEVLPRESASADTFFKARSEHPAQRVVGFFRTQPAGWPEMQESDREIARRCFQHPGSLFLLIQTPARRPWSAAFFDLAAERVSPSKASPLEFFFDEYLLRNDFSTALIPIPEQQVLPEPPPARRRTRWIALATLGALLLLGAGGYQWWLVSRNRGASTSVVPATSPLGLKVVRNGKDFEVSWDRLAPALQQSSGGTVTVSDGGIAHSVTLSPTQLREGRILYSPLFGDLSFRLEIQQGARTQAESVQVLSWDANRPPELPTNALPDSANALPNNNVASIQDVPLVAPPSPPPAHPLRPLPNPAPADARASPAIRATPATGKAQPPALPSAPAIAKPTAPVAIPPKTASFTTATPKPPEEAKPAVVPQIVPRIAPAKSSPVAPMQPAPVVPVTALPQPEAVVSREVPSEPAEIPSPVNSPVARSAEKPPVPPTPEVSPLPLREQLPPETKSEPASKSLPGPGQTQSPDPGYAPPVAVKRATPLLTPEVKRGLEGLHGSHLRLSVQVTVDTSGNVQNAQVLASGRNSVSVDKWIRSAALDAARRWKFRPGTLHGKVVPGDVTIEFNFQ